MSHSRPAHIGARVRRTRAPQRRPETVAEGVAWLRVYAVQLFEREMGREADWPVIAQTMFAAAFSVLDEAKGGDRALSVLRRVEAGLYNRLAHNGDDGLPQVLDMGPGPTPDPLRAPAPPEPRAKP